MRVPPEERRSGFLFRGQKKGNNMKFSAASAIYLLTPLRHAGGPQ